MAEYFEVVCGDFGVVCSNLQWFAVFQWTAIKLYFIPCSECNAYQKQIKVILSAVKKYRIFFSSDEYGLYFFTVANRGCFDNVGLNFFQKDLECTVLV